MENNGNLVKVIEVCKISPSSPNSLPSKFSLPLTSFDWIFLRFPPLQRLFFYPLSNNLHSFFQSIVVPNLKLSLSLTLQHYFPLAGALVWPDDSPLPSILYSQNDAVLLTLAESPSEDHFHSLSSPLPIEIHRSRSLLPLFDHSHSRSAIPMCAIQVTKFPNHGFSIGFSIHHVMSDGQSFNLFLKSWSHICKKLNQLESSPNLPHELIPSFDRSDENLISNQFDFVPSERNLSHHLSFLVPSDWHRATFDLTRNQIQNLKKRALEYWTTMEKKDEELHLSTFVVGYAHALVCLAKAKGEECMEKFYVMLAADARSRSSPPVATNYFGVCVVHPGMLLEARELSEEGNGFSNVAKKLGDLILELKTSGIDVTKIHKEAPKVIVKDIEFCSIGDSPQYKFYEMDFGWGKPKQVEMASLGCNNIHIIDARDGGGGLQLGLILPSHHMDVFASLFVQGLD